jgi:hypothetical protein
MDIGIGVCVDCPCCQTVKQDYLDYDRPLGQPDLKTLVRLNSDHTWAITVPFSCTECACGFIVELSASGWKVIEHERSVECRSRGICEVCGVADYCVRRITNDS